MECLNVFRMHQKYCLFKQSKTIGFIISLELVQTDILDGDLRLNTIYGNNMFIK